MKFRESSDESDESSEQILDLTLLCDRNAAAGKWC